ncbi:MAG: hypothetical protein HOQ07_07120 [Sinomonas sp.]|nr:hypothetical protein [Sinomonas sp.]
MNAPSSHVRSASFEVTVRPARAVYLVDATPGADRGGVRRAIQEASTRWGGACELIVLVGQGGAVGVRDRTMVGFSRADGAVNVNLPAAVAESAAGALGLALVPLRDIDEYGPVIGTSHPGIVGGARTADGFNGFLIASRNGKLWEAAVAGDLTDEHEHALTPELLSVRRPHASNYEIGLAQLGPHARTLAARTVLEFGENRAENNPALRPTVVWVTQGDDVHDIVEFWNVRALRSVRFGEMPMMLLPRDEIEYWTEFDRHMLSALGRPNSFEPDVVLASRSVSKEDLTEFAAKIGLVAADAEPHSRPAPTGQPTIRTEPFTYNILDDLLPWVSFHRTYGRSASVVAAVYDEHSTLEFPSPVPFTGSGKTQLLIGGPALAGLPRQPVLAGMIKERGLWRDSGIQITTLAQSAYRIELTVPRLAEATRAVLSDATTKWALSDKGAVGIGLLENTDIRVLLEPDVFEALLALTTPRSKHMAAELARALGREVTDLTDAERQLAERWSGRAERQFRSAANLPLDGLKGPDRLHALDRLAGVGWAERGLQVACQVCRLDSFLPLAEEHARGQAYCPGCGSPSRYIRGNTSVEIAYRLDSRIDRAADQGVLAHLLTIAALRSKYTSLHLLPGVDVWLQGETEKKEIDLYGICDGEIAAGEVKQSPEDFTEEQMRSDVQKSAHVGADIHIMASPGTIAASARALATRICEEAGLELVLMDKTDLRP